MMAVKAWSDSLASWFQITEVNDRDEMGPTWMSNVGETLDGKPCHNDLISPLFV